MRPWDYRWSSCRAYALGESNGLLTANPWYEGLSVKPSRRQALWREFLLGDPHEAEIRRSDWVVGGETIGRRMRQVAGWPAPRGAGTAVAGGGKNYDARGRESGR